MVSKKNISFIHVFFIILILVTTVSIAIIGYLWISSEYARFQEKSMEIRSDFIAARKALIQGEVLSTVDFINYKISQTEERLKTDIKNVPTRLTPLPPISIQSITCIKIELKSPR